MAPDEPDRDDPPDDEIRELLRETARQRRWNGLKFIGAGLASAALAHGLFWLIGSVDDLGGVERTVVLVVGYGGYFLGALGVLSGLALFGNSLVMSLRS